MEPQHQSDLQVAKQAEPVTGKIVHASVGDVLRGWPSASADFAVLDPAYGLGKADWDTAPDYDPAVIRDVIRVLKPGGTAYVFGPMGTIAEHWKSFPSPKRLMVWAVTNRVTPRCKTWQPTAEAIVMLWRGNSAYFDRDAVREPYGADYERHRGRPRPATPGRFGSSASIYADADGALPRDVIKGPGLSGKVGAREGLGHPCQKPEWLLQRLISASCPPGGVVLDLYAGTCTASVAAQGLGRRWFAVESDAHWCEVGAKRLRAIGAEPEIVSPSAHAPAELASWKAGVDRELAHLREVVAKLSVGASGSTGENG